MTGQRETHGGRSRPLTKFVAILIALAFVVLFTSITSPPPGYAAFPGVNGKIAFQRGGDIWVMNADGSGQANLTNNAAGNSSPAWSHDGKKIAFISDRDGNVEIYVMNADGSNQTHLTNNSASDFSPSWSPDGTKIAFIRSAGVRHGEVWIINADGTGETQLVSDAVGPFPSYFSTAWSPDGTKIALSRSESDTHQENYVINADGSGLMPLTSNGVNTRLPSWSPDGTKIAFARGPAGSDDIYVMNADGTNQTNLTNNGGQINGSPAWSPDGTKITFDSFRTGEGDIFVMNADGTNQTNLTNTLLVREGDPDWQPLQPDEDNDGVPDDKDACPGTPAGEVVDAGGCSIDQLCPCDGPWKNHSEYVSCVAHTSKDFEEAGLITKAERDAIVSQAAQSSCGKKK